MNITLRKEKGIDPSNLRKIIQLGINFGERLNTIEASCIEEYDPKRPYTKGDHCYYNNYLYEALASTSGEWNPSRWKIVGDTFYQITKADVESLIGLTQEEIQTLSSIISDTEVRLDKTYSSSKIYMDLQKVLEDSKTFTLSQFAKSNKASYRIANSLDEMVDTNIFYLYNGGTGTNYDIYASIDGEFKPVASMNIDLSDFYTKSEVDETFLKKTDATLTYATIETVNNKLDSDKVVSPSETSTISQVANAKDTFDMISSKQPILRHNLWSLDEINRVDRTEVSYGYINADTAKSVGILDATDFFHVLYMPWDTPYPTEILTTCSGKKRMYLRCCSNGTWSKPKEILTENDYIKLANLSNDGYARISSWIDSGNSRTHMSFDINTNDGKTERIQFDNIDGQLSIFENDGAGNWTWKGDYVRTKVPNVPLTLLSLNSGFTGHVYYQVKNGYCTVVICALICHNINTSQIVSNDLLPNPVAPVITSVVSHDTTDMRVGLAYIDRDIRLLKIHVTNNTLNGTNNTLNGYATFSYPVAES